MSITHYDKKAIHQAKMINRSHLGIEVAKNTAKLLKIMSEKANIQEIFTSPFIDVQKLQK